MTELKNRGLQDGLICGCDGLTGFPAAIEAVSPKATVQLCMVHLISNALSEVIWKDHNALPADLKGFYGATA